MKNFINKKVHINYHINFQIPYGKIVFITVPTFILYGLYNTILSHLNTYSPEFMRETRHNTYLILHSFGLKIYGTHLVAFLFFLLSTCLFVFFFQRNEKRIKEIM